MKPFEQSTKRSANSIRNISYSLLFFVLSLLASFANRTVFARCLSLEYLGLRGLLTSLLDVLSLAELGIGSAISYMLYKPLMQQDTAKLKTLMLVFRKCYQIVGTAILGLGAALVPFLAFLMKEIPKDIPMESVRIYFMLYAANTAAGFFLSYKRILVVCDQRSYISKITGGIARLGMTALQIAVLIMIRSFLWYLLVMILCTVAEGLAISRIADRLFPYLRKIREADPLSAAETEELRKNVAAIMMHNIGTVIVFSSDNLIISKFVGLVSVGLYSNYVMLISTAKSAVQQFFSGASASLGNLMAEDAEGKGKRIFRHMLFMNAWLGGWAAICLMLLIQPFIRLWLGASYVMDTTVPVAAVLNFYVSVMRETVLSFKRASGVFRQDRYKPLIEGAVNIIVSVPLAILYGIAGVLAGTVISTLTVAFWYEAKVLFRDRFHEGIGKYLGLQTKYFGLNLLLLGVCYGLSRLILFSGDNHPLAVLLFRLAICLTVPNIGYILCFRKTDDMIYFRDVIRLLIRRRTEKKKTNGVEG